MANRGAPNVPPSRAELEKLMAADLRAMTARSDRVGRHFARQQDLHSSDLHALLHIMVAETAGEPLNSSQLRERMGISNAAITYLVDRVMSAGHPARGRSDGSTKVVAAVREPSHGARPRVFRPARCSSPLGSRRSVRRRFACRPPGVDGDDRRDVDV